MEQIIAKSTPSCSTKQRTYYLDVLRIIGCILVITVHVSALNYNSVPPSSIDWQIMNLFDCLGALGVPIFVMISGSLLLDPTRTLTLRDLFKKIIHLAIIYLVWLLLYNTLEFIQTGTLLTFENVKDSIILRSLLGKGIYHLWYIPMIITLYLITPILREAFSNPKICRYFLVLFFLFGLLLPTLLLFEFPYKTIVSSIYDRYPLTMLTGYLGYFVLGHFLHSYAPILGKLQKHLVLFLGLLGYASAVIICGLDGIHTNTPSVILNNPLTVNLFLATVGVFYFCKERISVEKATPSHVKKLSSLTFGIYLIHPMVIGQLFNFGLHTLLLSPILMIPLMVILVFVISTIIVGILSYIPVIKKIVS